MATGIEFFLKPDKVTLSEWQAKNDNVIFNYLIDTAQVKYLEDTDAEMMRILLTSMYGQRKMRIFFEDLSPEEGANLIHKVYSKKRICCEARRRNNTFCATP